MLTAGLGTGIALANGSSDGNATAGETTGPDNSWQIVSCEYGVANADCQNVDDNVRVRKTVESTGTENEFIVHLQIDKKADVDSFFANAVFITDNNMSEGSVGGYSKMNGQLSLYDRNQGVGMTPTYFRVHVMNGNQELYVWQGVRYAPALPGESKSYFIRPQISSATSGDDYKNEDGLLLGQGTGGGTEDNPIDLTVDVAWDGFDDAFGQLNSTVVSLGTVTDVMGEDIVYLGDPKGDYDAADGVSFDNDSGTLAWTPTEKSGVSAQDGWLNDIAELSYRIRLDVTADGFASTGYPDDAPAPLNKLTDAVKYATNKEATLSYDVVTITVDNSGSNSSTMSGNIGFPIPVVRGLLYDLVAMKHDGNGGPLSGAKFGLFDENGDMVDSATSGDDGRIVFTDLPCGTYTVKEVAPPAGYAMSEQSWQVTVCHTTNPDVLTTSTAMDQSMNAMAERGDDEPFVNQLATVEATINVSKSLDGRAGEPGSVFTFTLEPQDADTPMPVDGSGKRMTSLTATIDMSDKAAGVVGTAAFPTLPIPAGEVGDYTYIVTENKGGVKGVVYSKAVYMVTVHADEQGKLTYTYTRTKNDAGNEDGKTKYEDTALFVNGPTEFAGTQTLTKYLVGRNWQEGDAFTFRIEYTGSYPENSTPVPVPESSNGTVRPVEDKPNTWDVTLNYDSGYCEPKKDDGTPSYCRLDLGFRTVYPTDENHHLFYYKVTELFGDMPGMLYSKAEYKLKADVFRVDDPSYGDGTGFNVSMLPTQVLDDDGNSLELSGPSTRAASADMKFTNTFVSVSALPLTGGDSTARSLLLAGGGVLLVAGAAWLLARRRRA